MWGRISKPMRCLARSGVPSADTTATRGMDTLHGSEYRAVALWLTDMLSDRDRSHIW